MAEDSIKRKKDAVGEPVGNGGPGSFAKAGPNTEAAGVDLTPVNIGPVIIQVNGLPFKLSERREIEPAYPEGLPTAEVTFDFGDEDGTTYTHVNIGGDEGEEGVSLTVWMQDGERCDSTESEEHGYDEDTMYDLIRWAHGVNDNVESNIAGYLNTMSPEAAARKPHAVVNALPRRAVIGPARSTLRTPMSRTPSTRTTWAARSPSMSKVSVAR